MAKCPHEKEDKYRREAFGKEPDEPLTPEEQKQFDKQFKKKRGK